jgi:hypothetical protein
MTVDVILCQRPHWPRVRRWGGVRWFIAGYLVIAVNLPPRHVPQWSWRRIHGTDNVRVRVWPFREDA